MLMPRHTAINHVPIATHTITTPTGSSFDGVEFTKSICGVSILRAGASMEQALRNTWMYVYLATYVNAKTDCSGDHYDLENS